MHIPTSTYRIQFTRSFGFQAAKRIIPYLAELGITDVYASPIFMARSGSMHGYDIVDPNRLNPDLGTEQDFNELHDELKKHQMGWLQDIVPNHMAYDSQNQTLMDILEKGPDSDYFNFFDIDWDHPYESINGRILTPLLGEFYSDCLENGKLKLVYEQKGFSIQYYEHKFPIRIDSYATIITHDLDRLRNALGSNHPDFVKFLGVVYTLKSIPPKDEIQGRYEQTMFAKSLLWELFNQSKQIKKFINENIDIFNGTVGEPESFNLLDRLLSEQFYRLSFWKVGTEEINYKRFFNVNELISLNTRNDDVFQNNTFLIFEMIQNKKFDGLRIDHIDGLYNPSNYLIKINQKSDSIYLVVEKILNLTEEIPSDWPVQGTTGYDFLNVVNGLFCNKVNRYAFDKIYRKFSGFRTPFSALVHEKKRLIIGKHMAGDVDNLSHILSGISDRYRYARDFTQYGLRRALVEILSWFPVYRTYISNHEYRDDDRLYIKSAVDHAKKTMPDFANEMDFIHKVLSLDTGEQNSEEEREQWLHFIMRFQQMTGPLMAKGFEDTVLYNHNAFISLNEVGGSPENFGISEIEFHNFNKKRSKNWPHSMSTTSTHDTKRGEDVRARLNVLSEIPQEWEKNIKLWRRINRKRKRVIEHVEVPDRNDEYFLYQTLLGAFPFEQDAYPEFKQRIKDYIIKAVREAKIHTAWLQPDLEYEQTFLSFVDKIMTFSKKNRFLEAFLPFQRRIAHYGIFNSLSQTLVKITAPGIPDFYQGTELWDLNLVDPDNRRPVDYKKRMTYLQQIQHQEKKNVFKLIDELLTSKEDGRIKLFLAYKALQARNEFKELFQRGEYVPFDVQGEHKDNVVAFGRKYERRWAVTLVPRFLTDFVHEDKNFIGREVWGDTQIVFPEGVSEWKNIFTGEKIKNQKNGWIGEILNHFPVCLLIGDTNNMMDE